ncbi:AraC family transcriptional regulator [Paenibacillus sp. YAF4_2]|uniref:AraC family transcriptional regulator n=1 Tax=Paenibacillus sp. YAF4_2 TaxID=3233085 RepID=UPI003F99729C
MNLHMSYDITFRYYGKQHCEPGLFWGPGVKDHFKILFIHEGKGIYQVNGQTYVLEKGQGFLVFPNHVYYMCADDKDPWVYSWIAFVGKQIDYWLNQVQLGIDKPFFHFSPFNWYDSYINEFDATISNERTSLLYKQSIMYRLMADWVDLLSSTNQVKSLPKVKETYTARALDYIKINYGNRITVSGLPEMIGIDRVYLSSLFKESIGLSPQQYLLQVRMQKACALLNNRSLSIAEICIRLVILIRCYSPKCSNG